MGVVELAYKLGVFHWDIRLQCDMREDSQHSSNVVPRVPNFDLCVSAKLYISLTFELMF